MLALSYTGCSVYGCNNTYKNTENVQPPVRFYSFPGREWEKDRCKKWINFTKRMGEDRKPWVPTKYAKICSQHFVDNAKSQDPRSPSYNPSIHPNCSQQRNDAKSVQRYLRLKRRNESWRITECISDENIPIPDHQIIVEKMASDVKVQPTVSTDLSLPDPTHPICIIKEEEIDISNTFMDEVLPKTYGKKKEIETNEASTFMDKVRGSSTYARKMAFLNMSGLPSRFSSTPARPGENCRRKKCNNQTQTALKRMIDVHTQTYITWVSPYQHFEYLEPVPSSSPEPEEIHLDFNTAYEFYSDTIRSIRLDHTYVLQPKESVPTKKKKMTEDCQAELENADADTEFRPLQALEALYENDSDSEDSWLYSCTPSPRSASGKDSDYEPESSLEVESDNSMNVDSGDESVADSLVEEIIAYDNEIHDPETADMLDSIERAVFNPNDELVGGNIYENSAFIIKTEPPEAPDSVESSVPLHNCESMDTGSVDEIQDRVTADVEDSIERAILNKSDELVDSNKDETGGVIIKTEPVEAPDSDDSNMLLNNCETMDTDPFDDNLYPILKCETTDTSNDDAVTGSDYNKTLHLPGSYEHVPFGENKVLNKALSEDASFFTNDVVIKSEPVDVSDSDEGYEQPNENTFIVYESCLLELLKRCTECGACIPKPLLDYSGSKLFVTMICVEGHETFWQSQPDDVPVSP